MQLNLEIAARTAFPKFELFAMQRLRAKVFSGRMGWEVPVMSGSRSVHVERQLPSVPARP